MEYNPPSVCARLARYEALHHVGKTLGAQQDGTSKDTALNDVQVMTVSATAGTYTIEFYLPAINKTLETQQLQFDASSEQVRQPIYTGGVDHWRRFEPWLAPLADALGPIAHSYPDLPPR